LFRLPHSTWLSQIGKPTCKCLKENDAHGIPVAGCGYRPTGFLFGRHIGQSAINQSLHVAVSVSFRLLDQAEIEDHNSPIVPHQDIGWFEVSMELPRPVQCIESSHELT